MTYVIFVVGLVALFLGGEFLVRGAVDIARRFRVPPLVIGLTVVGFGTSAPELLVSVQAALAGTPAIAIGNVIGSNIANILLILGVSGLIAPIALRFADLRTDLAVMIGATLALWAVLWGGTLTRIEGLLLLVALGIYLTASLRQKQDTPDLNTDQASLPTALAFALGGLLALMLGARFLVDSATEIARNFGVSEAVIGLTIVAVGTSLPELATSLVAAMRRQADIAVGNIIGSNIFNIFAILGITAVVTPIPVAARFYGLDMALALAAALGLAVLAVGPGRIGRVIASLLLVTYSAYIGLMALG